MAHEKLPAQTFKLTLSRTASYWGLAAVLTIALDVLTIGLGVAEQPPDTPGVLPALLARWAVLQNRSSLFSPFALKTT